MRTGAEGPDSGSLIFSRMKRSWFVSDVEGILNFKTTISDKEGFGERCVSSCAFLEGVERRKG
jgi:hypothetical protein